MGNCVGTKGKNTKTDKSNSQINNKPVDVKESKIDSIQNQVSGRFDSTIRNSQPVLADLSKQYNKHVSGEYNNAVQNIQNSSNSFGIKLDSKINQMSKGLGEFESGFKQNYNNITSNVADKSKQLFNSQEQVLNQTPKEVPLILEEVTNNIYLPTQVPYPTKSNLKKRFNWLEDTSDENFRLQPEVVMIPSINLKIS